MSSKPITRSASRSKGKTSAPEVETGSPTHKSAHVRRRKSAPAVTEAELVDDDTSEDVKGKTREKPKDKAERVLGLKLDGLKDKLGEGLEDLTVKLHPTVRIDNVPCLAHADNCYAGEWSLQTSGCA